VILRVSDRFTRVLAAGIVSIALAGSWAVLSRHALPDYPGRGTFIELFLVNRELNVPTWFSSVLLLVAAVLAGLIAWLTHREEGHMVRRWAGLSLILLYVSMDEVASIHDRYLGNLNPFPDEGILFYGWVVPAAVLVLLLVVAYARLVFRLPIAVRRLTILAAALFVGGALGLELIQSALDADAQGPGTLGYDVIAGVEEILENAGTLVFVVALLRYIGLRYPRILLVFDEPVTASVSSGREEAEPVGHRKVGIRAATRDE
jgi:hypothetical protein